MISYSVNAFHLTEKLKIKELGPVMEMQPLLPSVWESAYKLSEDSYIFAYNFGSVVFFNVPEERQKTVIERIKKASITEQPGYTTTDTFIVEVAGDEKHEAGFNKAVIPNLTYAKARLISMVVAESAALEYFELIVDDLLERTHEISARLRTEGRFIKETKQLLKFIGFCLTTKQEIIANLYVVDAPDEVWDDQVLDRLYNELKRSFEIETRYRVLEYKLKLIQESLELIVDLSKSGRQTMLELIVIFLIAFELILALFGGGRIHT